MNIKRLITIVSLYLCGVFQGFVMVSIPASASILKSVLHLTDSQYSMLFLPQLVMAIVGALMGSFGLRKRAGLPTVLIFGVLSNTIAMFCLYFSGAAATPGVIFPMLLASAAFIGLGFGLCAAPLSNLPMWLFPGKASSAMVALHTVVGIGFMFGPQFVSNLSAYNSWPVFPMWVTILGLTLIMNLLFTVEFQKPAAVSSLPDFPNLASEKGPWKMPVFWLAMTLAILYAFCESTLSNWAVIFLNEEKGLSLESAAWALSGFWAGLTMGRFLVSAMLVVVPASRVWQTLPIIMLLPFLLLNSINGPGMGAFVFIIAGMACSGFFPLTIRVMTELFPSYADEMAALTTAFLMIGIGLGSYILGPLRSVISLSTLYQVAVFYPLLMVFLTRYVVRKWFPEEVTPLENPSIEG